MNTESLLDKDMSRSILNNISLDDLKEKQKKGNEIDLELPLSKRHRPDKLDKAQIILEPLETVVTPIDKSSSQTGIEIKSETEENKNNKDIQEMVKSQHEEY